MNTQLKPLIMIIDDNDIDIFINQKVVKVKKISDRTITFKSAEDGLKYLMDNANYSDKFPSIILLDIQMPLMDGFQFLERFNLLPESITSKCRIIMLSSSTDPVDLNRANANPFVIDILKKPLTGHINTIGALVNKALATISESNNIDRNAA